MIFDWIINLFIIFFLGLGSGSVAVINPDVLVFKVKPDSAPIPWNQEATQSAAVLSLENNFFIFTHRADEVRSIASITKLMTALVFLDHNPGWESIYEIGVNDRVDGGRLNLFLGERLSIKELFYTSLIASDNGATLALVRASGLSVEEFVIKMNEKAHQLGLTKTSFDDPVGLSDQNVSTAREVALLAKTALSMPDIKEAVSQPVYEFTTLNGREKRIESTDYLLFSEDVRVLGGKTGYTEKAGYCYVGHLQDETGQAVIAVVLGASDRNDRFVFSRDLALWAFNYYDWQGLPLLRELTSK